MQSKERAAQAEERSLTSRERAAQDEERAAKSRERAARAVERAAVIGSNEKQDRERNRALERYTDVESALRAAEAGERDDRFIDMLREELAHCEERWCRVKS